VSDPSRLITVIGRGHSGTRAIALTLQASGVYIGDYLNASSDLLPPQKMYDACRVLARHVVHNGGVDWDFSGLHEGPIDPEFINLVEEFLVSVLNDSSPSRGWKLPETTLAYPWIVRMFPDAHYIHWYRDPRDSILGGHVTDDLADFGVPYDATDDDLERRAISWKYQYEIIKATPAPKNVIEIRFEDFVLKQEETLGRMEAFLGMPLCRIAVRSDAVGRWRRTNKSVDFDFFAADIEALGY
jgi:hypothetical protein